MPCYDYHQGKLKPFGLQFPGEVILPNNNIILQRTPFTGWGHQWDSFFAACGDLKSAIGSPHFVFVDASWDPVLLSNEEITQRRGQLQEIWSQSKICILSSRVKHFYDNLLGCIWFPAFLMYAYPDIIEKPRAGRIGCLNRRNAFHRIWLMHHLLDQKLIDPDRDVYSVSFKHIYSGHYFDHHDVNLAWFNHAQRQWPETIQTHPDNFPNDYSTGHPAWHTGITIITETLTDTDTLICEKTAKGILAKCCFSVFMHEVGYQAMEDLGFFVRFFDSHAQFDDIEPILDICRTIATVEQALEYRQMYMQQIEHNFQWFAFKQGHITTRPWWNRYGPKLQDALNSL